MLCPICMKRSKRDGFSYCDLCTKAYTKLYREHLRANPDAEINQRLCGKCKKNPRITAQRWCLSCDKEYRKVHAVHRRQILSPEARMKEKTRSITRNLITKGILVKQPCQFCGEEKVEAHHPDYNKPMLVWWVCRPCHKFKVHGGHI